MMAEPELVRYECFLGYSLTTATLMLTFLIGLPLCFLSFLGAWKAYTKKEQTIISFSIVLFAFAVLQVCAIAEVSTIFRSLVWFTDRVDVFVSCAITYFSISFGLAVLHLNLTVITVLRYVYVIHPKLGSRINKRSRLVSLVCCLSITGLALGAMVTDFLSQDTPVFAICTGKITFLDYAYSTRFYIDVLANLAITLTEFWLTAKVWLKVRKQKIEISVIQTSAAIPRRQLRNLLTIRGTTLCRLITLQPPLAVFIIRLVAYAGARTPDDVLLLLVLFSVTFACVTIGLPLICITESPFIRDEVTRLFRKPRTTATNTVSGVRGSTYA